MNERESGPWRKSTLEKVGEPDLPWPTFVRTVRRLSHNVRNHLNTAGLEVALAQDITTDPEVGDSLAALKQQLTKIRAELDTVLDRVVQPSLQVIEVQAGELFDELRRDVENHLGSTLPVTWELLGSGSTPVFVDLDLTFRVIRELLDNASRHRINEARPIQLRATESTAGFCLEVVEPKKERPTMDRWGKEPFSSTDPTRYGLGLWSVDQWVLALEGRVHREYDEGRRLLVTKVVLKTVS